MAQVGNNSFLSSVLSTGTDILKGVGDFGKSVLKLLPDDIVGENRANKHDDQDNVHGMPGNQPFFPSVHLPASISGTEFKNMITSSFRSAVSCLRSMTKRESPKEKLISRILFNQLILTDVINKLNSLQKTTDCRQGIFRTPGSKTFSDNIEKKGNWKKDITDNLKFDAGNPLIAAEHNSYIKNLTSLIKNNFSEIYKLNQGDLSQTYQDAERAFGTDNLTNLLKLCAETIEAKAYEGKYSSMVAAMPHMFAVLVMHATINPTAATSCKLSSANLAEMTGAFIQNYMKINNGALPDLPENLQQIVLSSSTEDMGIAKDTYDVLVNKFISNLDNKFLSASLNKPSFAGFVERAAEKGFFIEQYGLVEACQKINNGEISTVGEFKNILKDYIGKADEINKQPINPHGFSDLSFGAPKVKGEIDVGSFNIDANLQEVLSSILDQPDDTVIESGQLTAIYQAVVKLVFEQIKSNASRS